MNIPKLMELVNRHEHLRDIEAGVFFFENTTIVHQGPEIAARDIFHGKINVRCILESIQ